jgi:hypothetical protein
MLRSRFSINAEEPSFDFGNCLSTESFPPNRSLIDAHIFAYLIAYLAFFDAH